MISRRDLAEIIGEKTLKTTNTEKLAQQIAAFLLETRKTTDLESLIRDVMEYRADHGIVEATAVSAHQLDDKAIAQIKQILLKEHPKAKKVRLNVKIDKSVVGGLRIELANEQLNLTVRDKLDDFKRLTAQIKD